MKVRVRVPGRVYFDREQQKTFTGKGVIETKATFTVRQLLNEGHLIEVVEEPTSKATGGSASKATGGSAGKATSETKISEKA